MKSGSCNCDSVIKHHLNTFIKLDYLSRKQEERQRGADTTDGKITKNSIGQREFLRCRETISTLRHSRGRHQTTLLQEPLQLKSLTGECTGQKWL